MRALLPLAFVACGRVGFDARPDAITPGHDEDGDGIPDAVDNCPADGTSPDQTDRDGDGIGDLCDPHPDTATDRVVLFVTMQPGDVDVDMSASDSSWTQRADSIAYPVDGNHGELDLVAPLVESRIRIGLDVVDVGSTAVQHQIALGPYPDAGDRYFAELNELPGELTYSGSTWFDGASDYERIDEQQFAGPIPVGRIDIQATFDAIDQHIDVHTELPSGPLDGTGQTVFGSGLRDGVGLRVGIGAVGVECRYVWVTTVAPP